MDAEMIKLTL